METLEISKKNALKAYNEASKEGKTLLENLFTKEVLSQKITDRVKTFEDACEIVGIPANQQIWLSYNGQDRDMIAAQAYLKLTIIAKALNEGWTPDWSDSNEYKYYGWFRYSSGVGFSFYDFFNSDTYSAVGSRLCFKSSELAEYAGTQFESIYKDLITI